MMLPRLPAAFAVISLASAQTLPLTAVRSITGTDRFDDAGMAEELLIRLAPEKVSYEDNSATLWNNVANARDISNQLFNEATPVTNDRGLLDMVWQWGQFLDHDIDLTEECSMCGTMTTDMLDMSDPFQLAGCSSIVLDRSEYDLKEGVREQFNHITSFIDGSGVYGSDPHRAHTLRLEGTCFMKTSANGKLLPKNNYELQNAGAGIDETLQFAAGDIRANEQIGLTAMHTLFVREHNKLCLDIIAEYPTATADDQFEMARKIVGAEIQAITYKEFLPALLGPLAPTYLDYSGYNESVIPSIANEFSTAAYRFGHTMLSSSFRLADASGVLGTPIELKDVFFSETFFDSDPNLVDYILGGLQETLAQEIDPIVTDAVRNFLFGAPTGPSSCLDLVTMNIQRGRDHGIPSYNDLREAMGLTRYTTMAQVSDDQDRVTKLSSLYANNVDNVDAWVGMLSEDHVEGASVGELLGTMLNDQFTRLMHGDPFFYKGDEDLNDAHLKEHVMDMDKVTLQMIITRNTENNLVVRDDTQSAFVQGLGPVMEKNWPLTSSRSIDGSDRDDNKGEAHTPLMRMVDDVAMMTYVDDQQEMMTEPNPRTISNKLFSQSASIVNDRGLLDMVWQWGQFLDHDIDLTEGTLENGIATITIPNDPTDPFTNGNCNEITMIRSDHTPIVTMTDVRQQTNGITAFVDASNVYGSDEVRADALRSKVGGKLRMSENDLLPKNTGGLTNAPDSDATFFLAGDIRANEQSGLLAMHTLFVREHNRLADDLAANYPWRSDEELYQMARKLVIAQMQKITYTEFLPALLGPTLTPNLQLYQGYDSSSDPTIANEFSTFAYRVGHTMLSGTLQLANSQGSFDTVALRELFFVPEKFDDDHFFMDHILGGLMEQFCQEIDAFVVDDIRNHLFGDANGPGTCLDLATLNIQRGRDHGLPLYNDMRQAVGVGRYTSIDQITTNQAVRDTLGELYADNVDLIDAWVGGLAEDHVPGSSVGELVGHIIKNQFDRLMHGDPFFYLGDADLLDADLKLSVMDIEEVTLQSIIKRNTNIDHDPAVSAFTAAQSTMGLTFPPNFANRSIDGSDRLDFKGQAGTLLKRRYTGPLTYTDQIGTMMDGPSARLVSNTVFTQTEDILNSKGLLDMVWQWGQFLDHDIGLTEGSSNFGSMTIPIPDGDYFKTEGCPGIPFNRAQHTEGVTAAREQVNEITSFIDGSGVYGSDAIRADALRTHSKGELKTSQNGLNLPYNLGGEHNAGGDQDTSFLAGDIRANEQIGLIAMHTLFVREHNRLADLIATHYPSADDEQIYQMARKIVGAEIQAVTYKEFLPALLGPFAPDYENYSTIGYDKDTYDPSLANEFSTAIYRFGHSMISSHLQLSLDGLTPMASMSLKESFFSPEIYLENPYMTDMLLGGLMLQDAQTIDTKIIDDLRMFLFESPGTESCMDLAALNIQRGRDHGIPLYNDFRVTMGLGRIASFDEITFDNDVQDQLKAAYNDNVDEIELWVGALAEHHVIGGNVGELLARAMKEQFDSLMHGDKFFWLNDPDLQETDLKNNIMDIDSITLAKIIDFNTILDRDPSNSAFVRGDHASFPLRSSRSIEGSDRSDDLGEANTPLKRMSSNADLTYEDTTGTTMMTGAPNPRTISSVLMGQDSNVKIDNTRDLTDMVWQWGQFLDHDISLTEGHGSETANIPIPTGDYFATEQCAHIEFIRSNHVGGITDPREQINEITSFIDASMVYGSDPARADELRSTTNTGELKTSLNGLGLPLNQNGFPNAPNTDGTLFLAGDVRANEQMGLIAMHTLFVREHNRLAGLIVQHWPAASDDEVYELARKLVGAEIQKITYSEFLPALLGPTAPSLDRASYQYDETVDPRIANEFSTAIFRMGHTMINNNLPVYQFSWFNTLYMTKENLEGSFFETDLMVNDGTYADKLLVGLAHRRCQEVDLKIVRDVRDFLFAPNGVDTDCLDLAALNIQRGRDHGIPLYNKLREVAGLLPKASIDDITTNQDVRNSLTALYGSVDQIDAWVGALAEDHVQDSNVGELIGTIMKDQFERLAKGDPFFYLGDEDVWDPAVRAYILDIEDLTLAHVMDYNTIYNPDTQSAFHYTQTVGFFDPTVY